MTDLSWPASDGGDALLAACSAAPLAALPKLVLADWLQETGREDLGACLRWCAGQRKWPRTPPGHPAGKFAWRIEEPANGIRPWKQAPDAIPRVLSADSFASISVLALPLCLVESGDRRGYSMSSPTPVGWAEQNAAHAAGRSI